MLRRLNPSGRPGGRPSVGGLAVAALGACCVVPLLVLGVGLAAAGLALGSAVVVAGGALALAGWRHRRARC